MKNTMKLELAAISVNESFARSVVAAFALPLNPSLYVLSDIKTAVSEAVTNCIVHAYRGADFSEEDEKILIEATTEMVDNRGVLHIRISDFGRGIEDVERAMLPFYTSLENEERSGMGFTVMQAFMTEVKVESTIGKGTTIALTKIFETDEG